VTEAAVHDDLRPLLFSIAYRMVGSVSDAEDIVQDAYLRYHRATQQADTDVDSPKAYLSTVTTRLALDHLRSARVRREEYIGPWLPEPMLTDPDPGAAELAETADSLSVAFLVVLESLSPVERAVFLLHDVFDFSYAEIAAIVDKSEANCRQIATRARRHVDERRPRFTSSPRERAEITERFLAACRDGEVDSFVTLLADDVVFYGDGGGHGYGIPNPVYGGDRVARLLVGFRHQFEPGAIMLEPAEVNGQPGARCVDASGQLVNILAIDVEDGRIRRVWSVINHDKLRHLEPLADLAALLGEPRIRSDRTGT
jgi:RNA polymerase sigma-70 factor, ECF subfamily